jgi:hypothetical protein
LGKTLKVEKFEVTIHSFLFKKSSKVQDASGKSQKESQKNSQPSKSNRLPDGFESLLADCPRFSLAIFLFLIWVDLFFSQSDLLSLLKSFDF